MADVLSRLNFTSKPIEYKYNCLRCGEEKIRLRTEKFIGGDLPVAMRTCDECVKITLEEKETQRRISSWVHICPPLYQNTNRDKLPDEQAKKSYDIIQNYKFSEKGLVVHGITRRGKTRAVWDRIKNGYFNTGISAKYCLGSMFSIMIAESFEEHQTSRLIKEFSDTPILFFDDIGQMIFTERVQECLFTILEMRCAYLRPTIFTMNDIGETLKDKFSGNRGEAFVGRLKEFCEIVKF